MSAYPNSVAEEIAAAETATATATGDFDIAVIRFKEARRLAVETCNQTKLRRSIEDVHTRLDAEQRSFQCGIALRNAASSQRIVVFSDSLGLPSIEEKTKDNPAFDRTYSYVLTLLSKMGAPSVRPNVMPFCRRFSILADVAAMLAVQETAMACHGAHVLVHIGLNDTAIRMFMEDPRIALSQLTKEIREKVVGFAQTHRRRIILSDLEYTYVLHERFVALTEVNVTTLKRMGAKSITLETVILPASKFWAATPLINWNFNRYNQTMMDVARRHDAMLLDVGHLMWEAGCSTKLRADGMHLAEDGCNLLSRQYVALLDERGWE